VEKLQGFDFDIPLQGQDCVFEPFGAHRSQISGTTRRRSTSSWTRCTSSSTAPRKSWRRNSKDCGCAAWADAPVPERADYLTHLQASLEAMPGGHQAGERHAQPREQVSANAVGRLPGNVSTTRSAEACHLKNATASASRQLGAAEVECAVTQAARGTRRRVNLDAQAPSNANAPSPGRDHAGGARHEAGRQRQPGRSARKNRTSRGS